MKRMLVFVVLILICSVNVFAASTYIDQETGTEITLPENWSEAPLLKDRQYIDAKFINSDETAIITYSSYDVTTEGFSEAEAEELRKYLNMSIMTIEDAKEFFGEEGFTNVEKVTYNDVDYFKAELTTTHTLYGKKYNVEQLQFIHFNNGWCYYFIIGKTAYYEHYDDFKSLIESVKFPYSKQFNIDISDMYSNSKTSLLYYELFQKGPAVYIPVLFIMLLITLVAYAIFPLIFAWTRKKIITKTKYNLFCYGINLLVMFFFVVINGKSSGSPYFLWTCAFSIVGTNILKRRKVLEGHQPLMLLSQDENVEENDENKEMERICVCQTCGTSVPDNSMFCHKCGEPLIDNSKILDKCETKKIEDIHIY